MQHSSVIFSVSDMHCPSCPKIIKMTLEETKGVVSVDASLDTKQVVVVYDPALTTIQDLQSTIQQTGYTPKLITNNA